MVCQNRQVRHVYLMYNMINILYLHLVKIRLILVLHMTFRIIMYLERDCHQMLCPFLLELETQEYYTI